MVQETGHRLTGVLGHDQASSQHHMTFDPHRLLSAGKDVLSPKKLISEDKKMYSLARSLWVTS